MDILFSNLLSESILDFGKWGGIQEQKNLSSKNQNQN